MYQSTFGHPGERPITVVMIEEVIPIVVGDEQIEIAVVIVVTPGSVDRLSPDRFKTTHEG